MKTYGRSYFDRWYRAPRSRVATPADIARKAALAVSTAEYYLGRRIRNVLDVGCGEGNWQPVLARLRPAARYLGIDPSAYAVQRFGRRRNIRLGRFHELDTLGLRASYDLIVCSGMLNYLPLDELSAGLRIVRALLGGAAFLELYTRRDGVEGDMRGWRRETASVYLRLMREQGLIACGSHCYVTEEMGENVAEMERGHR
ncbi:MAG: class I SAM-dependent methyltransferase [Gemmatimonadaceae bacterium]